VRDPVLDALEELNPLLMELERYHEALEELDMANGPWPNALEAIDRFRAALEEERQREQFRDFLVAINLLTLLALCWVTGLWWVFGG
jgi:hypothetical protein